jgi:hypothetical protein
MYLLLFFGMVLSALAQVDQVIIKDLNFEYVSPRGEGTLSHVDLGLPLQTPIYPFSIEKTPEGYDFLSPFLTLNWRKAPGYIRAIEKLNLKDTHVRVSERGHELKAKALNLSMAGKDYSAREVLAHCQGSQLLELKPRLLTDCRKMMEASIDEVDVPQDFILYKVFSGLPRVPGNLEIPANDFILRMNEGNLFLQFYLKYVFYAGMRVWGEVTYEDDFDTIAIHVKEIRFGYLPVTNLVLSRLRDLNTNPSVKIDPPWIRISLK